MDLGIDDLEMAALAETWSVTVAGAPRTLRILRPELEEREDARLLFGEEIRRIRRLAHPMLLRVHEVGRAGERPWLLADPVGPPSLSDWTMRGSTLEHEEALALTVSIHEGFRYLQARKQVHLAPTPEQIVRVDGQWRLVTFRYIGAWDELRLRKGKADSWPAMSPPERQRAHPAPLKPEPFISWSLGALLRWMVAGTPPGSDDPPHAGTGVLAIASRLLADEPDQRPQGELAVRRLLAGEAAGPTAADGPAPPPIRAPIPRRKRRGR
jgi:hypothetical protein